MWGEEGTHTHTHTHAPIHAIEKALRLKRPIVLALVDHPIAICVQALKQRLRHRNLLGPLRATQGGMQPRCSVLVQYRLQGPLQYGLLQSLIHRIHMGVSAHGSDSVGGSGAVEEREVSDCSSVSE